MQNRDDVGFLDIRTSQDLISYDSVAESRIANLYHVIDLAEVDSGAEATLRIWIKTNREKKRETNSICLTTLENIAFSSLSAFDVIKKGQTNSLGWECRSLRICSSWNDVANNIDDLRADRERAVRPMILFDGKVTLVWPRKKIESIGSHLYQVDKPQKQYVRDALLRTVKKGVEHYWSLPSSNLYDVKVALDLGVISPKTHVTMVERDQIVADHMIRGFGRLASNDTVSYISEIHEVPLEEIKEVDFMFFDLCGYLTKDITPWFTALSNKLTPRSRVAVTVQTRANGFHANSWLDEKLEHVRKTHTDFFSRFKEEREWQGLPEMVSFQALLMKCALSEMNFTLHQPYLYRDNTEMAVIVASNFQKKASGFPTLAELFGNEPLKEVAMTHTPTATEVFAEDVSAAERKAAAARSLAAYKANLTRRLHRQGLDWGVLRDGRHIIVNMQTCNITNIFDDFADIYMFSSQSSDQAAA